MPLYNSGLEMISLWDWVFVLIALFMTLFQCLTGKKIEKKNQSKLDFGRRTVSHFVDNLGIKTSYQRKKVPSMEFHGMQTISFSIFFLRNIVNHFYQFSPEFRFVVACAKSVNMTIKNFIFYHCRRHQWCLWFQSRADAYNSTFSSQTNSMFSIIIENIRLKMLKVSIWFMCVCGGGCRAIKWQPFWFEDSIILRLSSSSTLFLVLYYFSSFLFALYSLNIWCAHNVNERKRRRKNEDQRLNCNHSYTNHHIRKERENELTS